jgi:hypothetical protein
MNDMLNRFRWLCLITLLIGMGYANLPAQGPPVAIDTCLIGASMRFKNLPIPSKFVPGDFEELRSCPSLGNNLVKIGKAKIGKAGNLKLMLRFTGGKLVHVQLMSSGEKDFKKLYKTVVKEAGVPTKMVESHGKLTYSYGIRSKIKGQLTINYDPVSHEAMVLILP